MDRQEEIREHLEFLYPQSFEEVRGGVQRLLDKWRREPFPQYGEPDQGDMVLITYGDALRRRGEPPLRTLKTFLDAEFRGTINLVHLLPMFPYSSDDGFSVIDFREINPELGTWEDIRNLASAYDLMFDAVINHVSRESRYFKGFAAGEREYEDFFISADPKADYSRVIRPRSLPLLTPVKTSGGTRHIWTTFSGDQMDLNYKNPAVLLEILDILLLYARRGARFIRFDAIGFAWKEAGTGCMHLPQVHRMVKLMRAVLQSLAPGCSIITETNVPHRDNISYFGSGHDEAALVYQFPLPPLVLFSFLSQDARRLSEWAASLEPTAAGTAYFNFLASHDGIGLRPVEDILDEGERELLVRETLARGGQIGLRSSPGGGEIPYELNINYLDAIAADLEDDQGRAQKFMASQCILLSVMGMPAVYYHSLFGSRGDGEAYRKTGIKRRINREKFEADALSARLREKGSLPDLVASRYKGLIARRKTLPAFHPGSPQRVLRLAPELFALIRGDGPEEVLVLVNVSGRPVRADTGFSGIDLISGEDCAGSVPLAPWQYRWIGRNP
jgi:sucrose phosphorylase